jgi:lysozyme
MTTSQRGIALIKQFEGLKLNAYLCSANVPTIGYGNTYYLNGTKVKLGDKISQEQAEELLKDILKKFEAIVNRKLKVKVNQNQFDALVSHTYNTGGSDTLFRLINNGANDTEVRTWIETRYITANGVKLKGLIRRRKAESDLYFSKNI